MDLRERLLEHGSAANLEEVIRSAIEADARSKWSVITVKATKDSDGKTAMLQPTVKAQARDADGKISHVDLPEIEGIVHFMGGGKTAATHPIKTDDEGVVIFASRAIDAWHQSGGVQQAVDTRSHHLSDGIFVPGTRSKPRDLKDINTEGAETRSDDGKHRGITHPANGIKQSVNGGKQILDINAKTGGMEVVSKTVVLASGEAQAGRAPHTENTADRDLNNIIKGLRAELTQVKDSHHALFDTVSKLRTNVESVVLGLAPINLATQVTTALSGQPSGLDAMKVLASGKLQGYFQNALKDALQNFLDPSRLMGATSVLGGNIEAQIQALTAQIARTAAENPAVAQVEILQRQVDAVLTRGASAAVEAAQLGPIQAQIEALTRDNPIIATAQGLQDQLKKLSSQAGAGLDFMGPQKRAAEGLVKSLRLSQG